MRSVIVLLVAANVAFLGVNVLGYFAPDDAPAPVDLDADDRAPRIEMLAEVDTRELRQRVQAVPALARIVAPAWSRAQSAGAPVTQPTDGLTTQLAGAPGESMAQPTSELTTQPAAEPAAQPTSEPMTLAGAPGTQPTGETTAEPGVARTTEPGREPLPEPKREPIGEPVGPPLADARPPPADGEAIAPDVGDPAAETDSEDVAIASAEGPARPDPAPIEQVLAAAPPAPAVPEVIEPLCFSVGPLSTPEEVAAMRAWLGERGGEATLRADERRELALFWVFFSPFPTREQAIERVELLRAQGVGDTYIIPRGDMANAVSLGVFSRRDTLERRLSLLRAKGYEPSVAPRYRTKKASWFDVAFDGGFDFRASGFAETFPAVGMSPGPCAAPPDAGIAGTSG